MSDDGWKDIISGRRGGPDGWLPTDAPGAGPNGGKAWVAGGSGSFVSRLLTGFLTLALLACVGAVWIGYKIVEALLSAIFSRRR